MERVREAADALGYRVNRVARGLKTSRSFTIGMLVPDITNPFFPPMVRGAGDGLSQAGYTLVLADTDNDPGKERLHQTLMLERQVDGLLLATARRRDDVIEELITHRASIRAGQPHDRPGRSVGRHPGRPGRHGARGRPPPRPGPSDHRAYRGSRDDVDGRSARGGIRSGGPFVGGRAGADDRGTVVHGRGRSCGCRGIVDRSGTAERDRRCQRSHRPRGARRGGVARSVLPGRLLPRRLQRHAVRRSAPASADDRPRRRTCARTSGSRGCCCPTSRIPRPAARRSCSRRSSSSEGRPPPPFDLVSDGFKVV